MKITNCFVYFNMLFELTASQTDNLKVSIDSLKQTIEQQTQTIEQQTQTIENLTRSNQKLVETQELKDEQILQFQELIKSLRTLLHSKNVDFDALRRLVFQGGREQKEQPAPQEITEKPQSKRKNGKSHFLCLSLLFISNLFKFSINQSTYSSAINISSNLYHY